MRKHDVVVLESVPVNQIGCPGKPNLLPVCLLVLQDRAKCRVGEELQVEGVSPSLKIQTVIAKNNSPPFTFLSRPASYQLLLDR
jgi:hypothetical protein